MKKYINLLLIVEAIICALVCVLGGRDLNFTSELLAFPFKPVAIGLRELSFVGSIANVFAWVIFILVCSLPVLVLVVRIIKKKFAVEDSLLVVISLIMTPALYHMININTMISEMIVSVEDFRVTYCILGAMIYSVIAAYVIMKIVRKFAKANKKQLKSYFNNVLFIVNVIVILVSLGFSLNELLIKLPAGSVGMTEISENITITKVFMIMEYAMDVVINIMIVGIIILVQGLVEKIDLDSISDEVVKRAKVISKCCVGTIVIHGILNILYNGLQLVFVKKLLEIKGVVSVPIVMVLVMLIIMLFTQFILDAKSIKEENDMFI